MVIKVVQVGAEGDAVGMGGRAARPRHVSRSVSIRNGQDLATSFLPRLSCCCCTVVAVGRCAYSRADVRWFRPTWGFHECPESFCAPECLGCGCNGGVCFSVPPPGVPSKNVGLNHAQGGRNAWGDRCDGRPPSKTALFQGQATKPRNPQGVLNDYVERFKRRREFYARMISAVHSPSGKLTSPADLPVVLWTGDRVAQLVVRLGLGEWVESRLA
jgi:hypothetical protein